MAFIIFRLKYDNELCILGVSLRRTKKKNVLWWANFEFKSTEYFIRKIQGKIN